MAYKEVRYSVLHYLLLASVKGVRTLSMVIVNECIPPCAYILAHVEEKPLAVM